MVKIFEWFDDWKDSILTAISKPIMDLEANLAKHLIDAAIGIMESNEIAMQPVTDKLLSDILDNPALPDEYRAIIESVKKSEHQADYPLQILMFAGGVLSTIGNAGAAIGEDIRREAYKNRQGLRLSPDEAIIAFYRGLIDEKQCDDSLIALGQGDRHRIISKTIREYYPTAQDFIRFAVRDTFNEKVVAKYHYDDEYPGQIDDYVRKIGMSPTWLKHHWRAHWQLPAVNQMYEMLHRNKITMDDARTLLKTNDIAPYFIEPLLAISYNNYTRVDVRRMYAEGVLSKDEVNRAYLDMGYDSVKAQKLTDWTTKEGLSRERDLTMAQTIEAYNEGEIDAATAATSLIKLGYDKEESALVLKLEQDKIERGYRKREKAILVKQYGKGIITKTAFIAGLDTLKMSEREKKIVMAEATLLIKEAAAAIPGK